MLMFGKIVALLGAPFVLAVTKKKPARAKRAAKPVHAKPVPRARAKKSTKRAASAPASKKGVPVQAEESPKPVEPPPPPPPPPAAPLQAPGLFSPPSGESAESLTPSFRWFYVGGASHYQLVWSHDANFHRQHILLTNQTAASLPPEQALEPETTYVWRVRGGNEGGWGPWSVIRSFRTPEK